MIRIQLSEAEAQRLEQVFRSASDLKLRDRLNVVRLAHRGRKRQDVADELGMSTRSVQRWLNAYLKRGLDGLAPRKAPGARPKIPAALADEIRRWVLQGQPSRGWTGPTGPTPNWPNTCTAPTAFAPVAPPSGGSAGSSTSGSTGPRTATCAARRPSSRRPGRTWPS
jgi:hypothetical protein